MPQTILAAGDYQQDEYTADGAALTPGHLVEETANGVAPHGTAAGAADPYFVREHTETGMGVDDDIPAGSNAKVLMPTRGSRVRARIAAGENVTEGDDLVSNGDGTLRVAAGDGTEEAGHVAKAYEGGGIADEVDLVQVRV